MRICGFVLGVCLLITGCATSGDPDGPPSSGPTYSPEVTALLREAESGRAKSQYALAWRFDRGEGAPEDKVLAARWYRAAAEQGHTDAQSNLGAMYHEGEGVDRDYRMAIRWYRKAIAGGSTQAMVNLAGLYEWGHGIPGDYEKAYALYMFAAEKGDPSGAENAQRLLQSDELFVTPDLNSKKLKDFRRELKKGVP